VGSVHVVQDVNMYVVVRVTLLQNITGRIALVMHKRERHEEKSIRSFKITRVDKAGPQREGLTKDIDT